MSRILATMLILSAIGCAGARGFDPLTTLAEDSTTVWGGQHARLQFTKDSLPRIDYDCAYGEMDSVPTPNARGEFTATGFHVIGHGGPVRVGETEVRHPAVYSGSLSEDILTLRVRLADLGTEIGPFTLRRGNAGSLFRCL